MRAEPPKIKARGSSHESHGACCLSENGCERSIERMAQAAVYSQPHVALIFPMGREVDLGTHVGA